MSGTLEFSAENVERALSQLYFDPSLSIKNEAQQWLTKAQRAKEAWNFAWTLLENGKATEVQFFGASCLVSKISASWSDIPECDIDVLRDRIFEQLLLFCTMPEKKIVLTRLCVVFSSFIINCTIRKIWPKVLSDILEKLQGPALDEQTQNFQHLALLEILTVLPEEYHTSHLNKQNKSMVMALLRGGMQSVLSLLKTLFLNPNYKLRVINCLSSWIAIGIPPPQCEDLMLKVLESIKEPELFEKSIDCMLNAFCSPLLSDYPQTAKKFVPIVLSLQPMLHKAIEEQDSENILGLTKVICSLAENQTRIILETCNDPQNGLGLIYLVMECTNVPLQYPTDEISSPISFTFWYSLQDELQALSTTDGLEVRKYTLQFFYQLVYVLLDKASYPSDNSHEGWSADEKEQHRIYRIDISDSLMYILEMLGLQVLMFIFDRFQKTLQQATDIEKSWHGIETCLFGIHSIVETLTETSSEIPCLDSLARILAQIPLTSVQLADTLLYTIGTLTEWLSRHPEQLQVLMRVVVPCIGNSDLSLSAVLTLRRLTRECAEQMAPYGSSVMEQISKVFTQGTLQPNEESWLIQSAGHILSVLPEDSYVRHTENLLLLHIHQLEALSKETPSAPNRNSILRILELLSHLFSTLDRRRRDEDGEIFPSDADRNKHVVELLRQLMPIFKDILNHWVRDVKVVQTLCSLYDRSVRTLVEAFAPLLSPLCEMLATVYQAFPYHSVLELIEQIVLVFGSDISKEAVPVLLRVVITTTRTLFDSGAHIENPDIAQGFMYLLSTVCRKQPALFTRLMDSGKTDVLDLFRCAIMTLYLPDSESAKSGVCFTSELLNLHTNNGRVAAALAQAGKELVKVSLNAIGGAAPRTCVDHHADVLFALAKCDLASFSAWSEQILSDEADFPCARIDAAQKAAFHKRMLREAKNKRKWREAFKDFSLVCRGLQGTEYANGS